MCDPRIFPMPRRLNNVCFILDRDGLVAIINYYYYYLGSCHQRNRIKHRKRSKLGRNLKNTIVKRSVCVWGGRVLQLAFALTLSDRLAKVALVPLII